MNTSEITIFFWVAQAIGPVTTLMSILSAQMKNLKVILIYELLINLLVALSYILLGGISGSYICIIASVQTAVSYVYARKNREVPHMLTALFVIVYSGISVYSYQSPLDILPGVSAVAFALAIVQNSSAGYRLFMGINSFLWIVYDMMIGAYTMLITHSLLLVSVIIAIVRYDVKGRKQARGESE